MYNEMQAAFEIVNGRIVRPFDLTGDLPLVGVTPEPCSNFQMFSLPVDNISQPLDVTADGTHVYKLAQSRLGTEGQLVNFYINFQAGRNPDTTPWIWTALQFDSNGLWVPFVQGLPIIGNTNTISTFPTTTVYTSSQYPLPFNNGGVEFANYPAGPLGAFIALDGSWKFIP